MKHENDFVLDNRFSYAIVLRIPTGEIEKLREFITTLKETKVVCESLDLSNHWITKKKPTDSEDFKRQD
jgi:hypothetical protein